jgi:hypothetical protein
MHLPSWRPIAIEAATETAAPARLETPGKKAPEDGEGDAGGVCDPDGSMAGETIYAHEL